MGSSSSSQPIGYHFKYLLHTGWCHGPIDAFLEWRVGGRTAWVGRLVASAQLWIDRLDLFGGEKGEGGVQTALDVLFGERTQAPNDYLTAQLGPKQSGNRDKFTTLVRGGIMGAFAPYPKEQSVKVERILADWPEDTPWYPAKAPIPMGEGAVLTGAPFSGELPIGTPWAWATFDAWDDSLAAPAYDYAGWPQAAGDWSSDGTQEVLITQGAGKQLVLRRQLPAGTNALTVAAGFVDDYLYVYLDGVQVGVDIFTPFTVSTTDPADFNPSGPTELTIRVHDSGAGRMALHGLAVSYSGNALTGAGPFSAMNPAHMLYESVINAPADGGMGEARALVNDASLTAAADQLYAEGFGLCTTWEGDESAEEFQDRICNVIGARLNQSRATGEYHLDLIRPPTDLDGLLVLTAADVLDVVIEPADLAGAVNSVQVGWFDPQTKENRLTQPVTSLGAIQATGRVIAAQYLHREIPDEALALRVAARYLNLARPLARFKLTTNRKPWALRPGLFFRLQLPAFGIADVVCLAGDIDYGELGAGRMSIAAIQDVSTLPAAVFVTPQPGLDPGLDAPAASPHQVALELPWVVLAGSLSAADRAALAADAGYLGTLATAPAGLAINYDLLTARSGEAFVDRGTGDWCPSAVVVEAAPLAGDLATSFTYTGGDGLEQVPLGSWALWGDEWVQVVARDTGVTGALTLGRAVADTVPQAHAAGERIYFGQVQGVGSAAIHATLAGDRREYLAGETVEAKLLTRTPGALLAQADAPTQAVAMDQRAARPYPPGRFQIGGAYYPDAVVGAVSVSWVHRDRLGQGDQLLDTLAAGVGPEAGTTYTVRYYLDGVLGHTDAGVAGLASSWDPGADGVVRVELEAVRDGLTSWQLHAHEVTRGTPLWTPALLTKVPDVWLNDDGAVTDGGGGAATLWTGSGTFGSNFTRTLGTQNPLILPAELNGRRVLRFDGSNDYMASSIGHSLNLYRNVGSGWAFFVYKLRTAPAASAVLFGQRTGANTNARFNVYAGTGGTSKPAVLTRRLDADASATTASATATGTGAWVMLLARVDFTNADAWLDVNGVLDTTNTAHGTAGSTSNTDAGGSAILGADQGAAASFAAVDLAEVVLVGGALPTSTEIDKLFGYAAHRWGLTASLPVGHPYKTTPPPA